MVSLTRRLDGLPLAIVIAGSYMQQTGISPSKYLELYSQSWNDLQKGAQPYRYYSNGNLISTWMISYQEIQKNTPSAAKLLLLLACYDNQDIWYDLISQGIRYENEPGWLYEIASTEINFSLATQALLGYSLIQTNQASGSYSLHPVVQDWCQGYTLQENMKEIMDIAIISTGFSVAFSEDPQFWISQHRLLPHADCMIKSLQNREGPFEQPIMMDAIHNLGILYRDQGKLQEAKAMLQQALAGYEKVLGPDHTSTLDSINSLGILYRDQGKLQEAEVMSQQALAGYEKVLGPDHTSTLASINNLGNLYSDQGKLQEAEVMLQRALAGYQKALDPGHTFTIMVIHNLGILYSRQGKLQEAEAMLQRALAGYEKVLGPDHNRTQQTFYSLNLVHNQGLPYILYYEDHWLILIVLTSGFKHISTYTNQFPSAVLIQKDNLRNPYFSYFLISI
jgi:tetratricopeptide (TPR) repeat protein